MSTKKEIIITGNAVYPITIGKPAIISDSNGSAIKTSVVVNIENISETEIRFETKNSLYTLHETKSGPIAGLMLKKMFEMRDHQC